MLHRLICSVTCGIFQDWGLIQRFLHWQVDSYPLGHEGSLVVEFLNPETGSHLSLNEISSKINPRASLMAQR